jgi:carbohydrate kinase (thermoresistant glucokinase family)
MIIIIMGVSGSGKTTIGSALANKLGMMFQDADDYHSRRNIEKMAKGIPLDDADRKEWLETVSGQFRKWNMQGGAVLACSALKESYRTVLGAEFDEIKWVYLSGTMEKIRERLRARAGHYFNPKLLESQFETLEEPAYGVHVDIDQSVTQIVEKLEDIFK